MTDATWDDFVASADLIDPTGVVPAIIEAVADAVDGSDATWDEWTATAGAPTSTDDVGDQATEHMDANLSMASDLVGDGDLEGAYDALSAAQGFNDVAGDAYDSGLDSGFDAGY